MASDSEGDDDLFGGGDRKDDDSDNTADLIAASKSKPATSNKKKTQPVTASSKNDDESSDEGGLFDSDSDDDREDPSSRKAAAAAAPSANKTLSKRERLEALARRKKIPTENFKTEIANTNAVTAQEAKEKGYDSGDSYDSGEFQRTADDDAFIDATGEDADAVNELYAEQNFHEDGRSMKKGKKRRPDDTGDTEPDNPVMAAVHRMKKKKRTKKSSEELEDEVKLFLNQMDEAATMDEEAVAERRPATKKLAMLNQVCDVLTRRDHQRVLLEFDLLTVVKRWVQPLPNGTLGNVTVRQRLLDAVAKLDGLNANHLKRSGLGKTVMILYKHHSETPSMKRQLKDLVEQWSRPIFQKSGNMRDLERVQRGGTAGLAALSQQARLQQERSQQQLDLDAHQKSPDLKALLQSGKKGSVESGVNRVRVPYSKGFAFQVRPTARTPGPDSAEKRLAMPQETRGNLAKRMIEKGRKVGKNQRSANLSIEGRVTK